VHPVQVPWAGEVSSGGLLGWRSYLHGEYMVGVFLSWEIVRQRHPVRSTKPHTSGRKAVERVMQCSQTALLTG
jgi:hypothetical protein